MLIIRSPLRISLGGGGTDVPSYYEQRGGYVLSAAIDKYVYVTITRPFFPGIYLKYSEMEKASHPEDVRHPIVREALMYMNLQNPQIEITSLADIPSGTGLGSSGSFTTALLKALFTHYGRPISKSELAELACEIEIGKLREPIGKQDQYISVFGGITEFYFEKSGHVKISPLLIAKETVHDLEERLILFFTGRSRSASTVLAHQVAMSVKQDSKMIENLDYTRELGFKIRDALLLGDLTSYGLLMNEHWEWKRKRSKGVSNSFVDDAYDIALKSGAVGGKLVGAGGGGFLLFYASDKEKLSIRMTELGLERVNLKFDFEGCRVVA